MRLHGRAWLAPVLALVMAGAACSAGSGGTAAQPSKPAAPASGGQATAPGAGAPDKVSFRLGFFLAGQRLPYVTALEKGYYQAENLDVDLREGEGGVANAQLVANGNLMIAESDAASTASLRDKGINLKVIATFGQVTSMAIVAWKDAGVNTPADLAGKRLGVTPGEVPLLMLPAYLANNKVDPASVRQVPLDGATKFTTFINHQTDAATTYITSLPAPYFAQQDQFNLFMYSDSGLSMLADSLMVTDDTIRNQPDVLRRFLRATVRALKDCEADAAACAQYAKQFKETADPDLLLKQWSLWVPLWHTANTRDKPIGWMAEQDWVATLDILRKNGLLNTPTQPSDVYTNDFLPS
ncbi:MAG TPA: ABC transporter substrate-binding protein [Chloroflexota bacterium]|nr:ABC transporter substrate-binding protein [Chloroflexota bacterium]